MTLVIYGIPNCDSVKKARKWLEGEGIDYRFYDLRADGLTREMLGEWADVCGWHSLLNKRSATFRGLSDDEKRIDEREEALALMEGNPTLVKRPVATHEDGDRVLVGFNQSEWENAFG